MRYSPEHKAETRRRLLHAGAAVAKRNGFATTGVDGLMKEVGLTGAAFYNHFETKTEFFRAILAAEMECSRTLLAGPGTLTAEQRLAAYFDTYLSLGHVENPEHGCPIPALSQEVATADAGTKQLYEDEIMRTHAAMEKCLGDSDAAWAALAQSVGAVLIARAMKTKKGKEQILAGCRADTSRKLKARK